MSAVIVTHTKTIYPTITKWTCCHPSTGILYTMQATQKVPLHLSWVDTVVVLNSTVILGNIFITTEAKRKHHSCYNIFQLLSLSHYHCITLTHHCCWCLLHCRKWWPSHWKSQGRRWKSVSRTWHWLWPPPQQSTRCWENSKHSSSNSTVFHTLLILLKGKIYTIGRRTSYWTLCRTAFREHSTRCPLWLPNYIICDGSMKIQHFDLFWVWAHASLLPSILPIVMAALQIAVAHWW